MIDLRPDGRIDGALLHSFGQRGFAVTALIDERWIVLFAEGIRVAGFHSTQPNDCTCWIASSLAVRGR